MSKPMPKRHIDLNLVESDSDDPDYKSPITIRRPTRMMPKKASELAVVNSESEEDDNLNCAVNLNDSFIFTPSKLIFDTPMKPTEPPQSPSCGDVVDKATAAPARNEPAQATRSIFSVTSKLIQENDRNIGNVPAKKDISEELERLSLKDPTPKMIKSQSTSALGSSAGQQNQKSGLAYRPINQKLVQQQLQPVQKKEEPFWRKSYETTGDSGICSPIKLFAGDQQPQQPKEYVVAKDPPVFATPGLQKPPIQITASKRLQVNSRMPLSSATKDQAAIKNEFQQRKVLFTTPMGGACKPVSSIANASISLALDDSIQLSRLPELSHPNGGTEVGKPRGGDPPSEIRRIKNVDYAIEKKIGHGGSSTVFLGRRLDTGDEVAIKVVDLRVDDAVVEGYLNETKLLASLQGNPNIITLFDYEHHRSERDPLLYMVMERGETDLHKILQMYTTDIPLYKLMRYWYEILLAVDFIHQRGVIHLDLKPANFLMVNGRLKLIDFGIAAKINVDATSIVKDSQAGTYNYISPEALTDTSDDTTTQHPKFKISTKSDVWSLGCILYALIYKRTPFAHIKSIMMKVATITNPNTEIPFSELPVFYPPILLKMLKTCLKHDPKERASVQDLLKFPFEMIMPID